MTGILRFIPHLSIYTYKISKPFCKLAHEYGIYIYEANDH